MRPDYPVRLSIAAVSYRSPTAELFTLANSLAAAVIRLRQALNVASVPIYLIDNSKRPILTLDDFAVLRNELESADVELRLVQGHGNPGYGSAHNLALENLDSDFHLMLNPDITVDEQSLTEGINYLLDNPEVGLLSPHATTVDGTRQYLCKRYPSALTFLIRGFLPEPLKKLFQKRLARFEMHDLSESGPSNGVPMASGCFMLCRTAVLQAVGGFDSRYFLYFEDFDLSLRLGKRGDIAYLPAMKIQHGGGNAAHKGIKHIMMFVRSGIRFYNTHGWRLIRQ